MKKVLFSCVVAMLSILVGCKNVPTPEKMEALADSVGLTTGLVVKNIITDQKSIDVITNITMQVSACVPTNGETFVQAWTPIAQKYVDDLVDKNKITKQDSILIMSGFSLVTTGIDYIFDKVYPNARKYEELVNAAVRGFTSGFMKNFGLFDKNHKVIIDDELYKLLMEKAKK